MKDCVAIQNIVFHSTFTLRRIVLSLFQPLSDCAACGWVKYLFYNTITPTVYCLVLGEDWDFRSLIPFGTVSKSLYSLIFQGIECEKDGLDFTKRERRIYNWLRVATRVIPYHFQISKSPNFQILLFFHKCRIFNNKPFTKCLSQSFGSPEFEN